VRKYPLLLSIDAINCLFTSQVRHGFDRSVGIERGGSLTDGLRKAECLLQIKRKQEGGGMHGIFIINALYCGVDLLL